MNGEPIYHPPWSSNPDKLGVHLIWWVFGGYKPYWKILQGYWRGSHKICLAFFQSHFRFLKVLLENWHYLVLKWLVIYHWTGILLRSFLDDSSQTRQIDCLLQNKYILGKYIFKWDHKGLHKGFLSQIFNMDFQFWAVWAVSKGKSLSFCWSILLFLVGLFSWAKQIKN